MVIISRKGKVPKSGMGNGGMESVEPGKETLPGQASEIQVVNRDVDDPNRRADVIVLGKRAGSRHGRQETRRE